MNKIFKLLLNFIYYVFIYKILIFLGYFITKNKEKRTILGCAETAGVLSTLKNLYKDNCISYSRIPNPYYKLSKFDYNFSDTKFTLLFRSPFVFGKLLKNAKSFVYVGGCSYTLYLEKELQLILKKRIPIIDIFLGSEIRSPVLYRENAKKENRNTYYDYIIQNEHIYEKEAKRNAYLADTYASLVFSHKKDQISYLKKEQLFFPPIIDYNKIYDSMDKFNRIEKIKILHAPSNPNVKGTPVVRAVIKALQSQNYDFEYIELIGVDNSHVLNELRSSHIVLNQFYLLLPGIFGLESMANCTAVLMSAEPSEFPYEFNDAWFETKDYQLYDNLKYLLDNPAEIQRYAQNGFDYINKYFSKESIKQQINKHLSQYI